MRSASTVRLMRGVALLGVALTTACAPGSSGAGLPPSQPHPIIGRAVGFSLPDDAGVLRVVPDPASHATVLDFWATDCAPCARSLPALAAKRAALAESGVALHFIAVLKSDESLQDARRTLAGWGATTPFLADRDGGVQRRLNLALLPATLILDAQGNAHWLASSDLNADQIASAATQIARGD
jgi:thiol-disulfide isomerase/thioredoxin